MGGISVLLGLVKGLLLCQLVGSSAESTSLIVSPSQVNPDVAIIASIDGSLYLIDTKTKDVKWSLSTGKSIYSSFQADVADNASEPGSGDFFYLDCGDDWELYLHSKHLGKLQKFGRNAEDYIRDLPRVWENGQITLGEKKTTAFVVDAHSGTLIHSFGSEANLSLDEFERSKNPLGATSAPKLWRETQNLIFFSRTDYIIRHYSANSSDVLWSVSLAKIEADFRCSAIETSLSSGQTRWNFPCQLRTNVTCFRDR